MNPYTWKWALSEPPLVCTRHLRMTLKKWRRESTTAPRVGELQHTVQSVGDNPAAEPGQGAPEVGLAAPRQPHHGGGEEGEVDHPLRQALRPLRERIGVRQVEEPGQVDDQESDEERN